MLNKLQVLEDKYKELTEKISDIEVINDQKTWQKYMKEHADLEPIVMKYREYKEVVDNIKESKEILEEESDEELRELAKMELSDLESRVEPIEDELKILLLPKDPNDEKNVIVEIRGGAGGDEAALFAGDLFRMYSRYAERRRWKTELLSASDTGVGGYKEVSFMIKGKGAYSRLKYESGVHRVQRIPSTESGGRIHTSTATVAVLPEVEDVEIEINPNEMKILLFTSGTTGNAKGVALSQNNICSNILSIYGIVKVKRSDLFFSVLPLHHTYECTIGFLLPIYSGASICFCDGLRYIAQNMLEYHPSVILCVPLLLENLHKKIIKNLSKSLPEKYKKNKEISS